MDPDEGATLARTMTGHGTRYDELLSQGIPRHMLRHAWVVTNGDGDAAERFVHDNFDQPGAFWRITPTTDCGGGESGGGKAAPVEQRQPSATADDAVALSLARAHEFLARLPPEQLQDSGVVLADLESAVSHVRARARTPDAGTPVTRAASAPTLPLAREATVPLRMRARGPQQRLSVEPDYSWGEEYAAVETARSATETGQAFLCGLNCGDWVDVNIGSLRHQLVAAGTVAVVSQQSEDLAGQEMDQWVVAQVVSVDVDRSTPGGHLMRHCALLDGTQHPKLLTALAYRRGGSETPACQDFASWICLDSQQFAACQ